MSRIAGQGYFSWWGVKKAFRFAGRQVVNQVAAVPMGVADVVISFVNEKYWDTAQNAASLAVNLASGGWMGGTAKEGIDVGVQGVKKLVGASFST